MKSRTVFEIRRLVAALLLCSIWPFLPGNAFADIPGDHTVTDLGSLGGDATDPVSINDNGVIVGYSTTAIGETHAFLWQNGTMNDLGTSGEDSFAYGVNQADHVVGTKATSTGEKATLWENGNEVDLSAAVGGQSYAYGINNVDQVVGMSGDRGFLYQNGNVTYMTPNFVPQAINDSGQVVGFSPDDTQSFVWQNGTEQTLPNLPGDNTVSQALDISNDGTIIGYGSGADRNYHGLMWKNGSVSELPVLGSDNIPRKINDNDQIIGDGFVSAGHHDPILWQNGTASDLGPAPNNDFAGGRDINNNDQVILYYYTSTGRNAQLWSYNPTPSQIISNLSSSISSQPIIPGGISQGQVSELTQLLANIANDLSSGNTKKTCTELNIFTNQVSAMANTGKVSQGTANSWLNDANTLTSDVCSN